MEHEGHRERLRRRYEAEGLDAFETHNVLELLLFYAIPRKDTNKIAHRLEATFGSLSAVLEAPEEELRKIEGIGPQAASFLHFIPQICRKYMEDVSRPQGECIHSSEEAGEYLSARFIGVQEEIVVLLLISATGKIRFCDTVARGGFNSADVDLRKLLSLGMKFKSSSAILAHNHPSGVALPSQDDLQTTRVIAKALASVGVHLIDHIIVADGDYVSLADSGILADLRE